MQCHLNIIFQMSLSKIKMKAVCLYLRDVELSNQLAERCISSCKKFGLDVTPLEGHTPKMAQKWIKENNLFTFDPGPKLYKIKMSIDDFMLDFTQKFISVLFRTEIYYLI